MTSTDLKLVVNQVRIVLKKTFVGRVQREALVGVDFGLIDERSGIMQLCFSVLNRWWLFVLIGLLMISPVKNIFSIHQLWGPESSLVAFLFDEKILIPFIVAALIATLIPATFFWILFVFIIQSQGDVHVVISLAALSGLLFAEARKGLKKSLDLQGRIRQIALWYYSFSIVAVIVSGYLEFQLYYSLKWAGYFNGSIFENRLEFLALGLFINCGLQFLFVSTWGHFYTRRVVDPSVWNLKYSSAVLISHWMLSADFKQDLNPVIKAKIKEKESLGLTDVKGLPRKLVEMNEEENTFLQLAQHQLS